MKALVQMEELLEIGCPPLEEFHGIPLYDCGIRIVYENKKQEGYCTTGINHGAHIFVSFCDIPDLPILVHELCHVLDEVEKGIQDHLQREARAYLMEWLTKYALRVLEEHKDD